MSSAMKDFGFPPHNLSWRISNVLIWVSPKRTVVGAVCPSSLKSANQLASSPHTRESAYWSFPRTEGSWLGTTTPVSRIFIKARSNSTTLAGLLDIAIFLCNACSSQPRFQEFQQCNRRGGQLLLRVNKTKRDMKPLVQANVEVVCIAWDTIGNSSKQLVHKSPHAHRAACRKALTLTKLWTLAESPNGRVAHLNHLTSWCSSLQKGNDSFVWIWEGAVCTPISSPWLWPSDQRQLLSSLYEQTQDNCIPSSNSSWTGHRLYTASREKGTHTRWSRAYNNAVSVDEKISSTQFSFRSSMGLSYSFRMTAKRLTGNHHPEKHSSISSAV